VEGHPLAPRQVEQRRAEGALVVDVRTDLQFDDAHVPGSVSITILRAGFGSKLAWVAKPDEDIVLVGRDDEDARRAVELAAAVGLRRIGGYLHGGMTSWREERQPVQRIERVTVAELHRRMEDEAGPQVLDVREESEWRAGHILDSVHVPYHDIDGVPSEIDPQRPVATICGSGPRSALAASLLQRHGAREVLHVVDGGVGTWRQNGWPVEEG
jgi:rhodanese-related sulfurtransferase